MARGEAYETDGTRSATTFTYAEADAEEGGKASPSGASDTETDEDAAPPAAGRSGRDRGCKNVLSAKNASAAPQVPQTHKAVIKKEKPPAKGQENKRIRATEAIDRTKSFLTKALKPGKRKLGTTIPDVSMEAQQAEVEPGPVKRRRRKAAGRCPEEIPISRTAPEDVGAQQPTQVPDPPCTPSSGSHKEVSVGTPPHIASSPVNPAEPHGGLSPWGVGTSCPAAYCPQPAPLPECIPAPAARKQTPFYAAPAAPLSSPTAGLKYVASPVRGPDYWGTCTEKRAKVCSTNGFGHGWKPKKKGRKGVSKAGLDAKARAPHGCGKGAVPGAADKAGARAPQGRGKGRGQPRKAAAAATAKALHGVGGTPVAETAGNPLTQEQGREAAVGGVAHLVKKPMQAAERLLNKSSAAHCKSGVAGPPTDKANAHVSQGRGKRRGQPLPAAAASAAALKGVGGLPAADTAGSPLALEEGREAMVRGVAHLVTEPMLAAERLLNKSSAAPRKSSVAGPAADKAGAQAPQGRGKGRGQPQKAAAAAAAITEALHGVEGLPAAVTAGSPLAQNEGREAMLGGVAHLQIRPMQAAEPLLHKSSAAPCKSGMEGPATDKLGAQAPKGLGKGRGLPRKAAVAASAKALHGVGWPPAAETAGSPLAQEEGEEAAVEGVAHLQDKPMQAAEQLRVNTSAALCKSGQAGPATARLLAGTKTPLLQQALVPIHSNPPLIEIMC